MKEQKRSICIFGGARDNIGQKYFDHARYIGAEIAKRGARLVYGGSSTGVMHAAAEGAMSMGGEVLGIYPDVLKYVEKMDARITHLMRVPTMSKRKKKLVKESDSFVILPGGYGTLDEFFEVLTLDAIGFLNKPIYIYNQDGYWDHLESLMNNIVEHGFAMQSSDKYFRFIRSKEEVISCIFEQEDE